MDLMTVLPPSRGFTIIYVVLACVQNMLTLLYWIYIILVCKLLRFS